MGVKWSHRGGLGLFGVDRYDGVMVVVALFLGVVQNIGGFHEAREPDRDGGDCFGNVG